MMKKVTFPITLDHLLMSTPIRLTFDDVYNDIMIQLLKFPVVLYLMISMKFQLQQLWRPVISWMIL